LPEREPTTDLSLHPSCFLRADTVKSVLLSNKITRYIDTPY